MAEELIDKFVDRNGVESDKDYIVSAIRDIYREFLKLEAVKIDLKGAAGLSNMGPLFNQAAAGADSLATATQTVETRMASMNGKSKEFTQVLLTQVKAQKEAAQASLLEAKAATEAAKAKQSEAKATEQSAKAKAADKKLTEEAINDYLQLSKAYNEASLKAKNYALRLGEGHPIAVQAIKDANDLGNVLKKLDASVGQNQRNVGNYKSAFDGLGMSFAQVSRELPSLSISFQQFALAISNNLPMVADELKKAKDEINAMKAAGKDAPSLFSKIGSALFSWQVALSVGITLLTLFSKQIGQVISSLFNGGNAFDAAKEATKAYSEASREAVSSTAKEIGELQALYKVSQSTVLGIEDRREATKRIIEINKKNNEQTGETNKLMLDQNGILKEQPELIDKISQSLIRQAKTKAVLNLLEEGYKKLLEAQTASITSQTNKLQDASIKTGNFISKYFRDLNPFKNIIELRPIDLEKYQKSLKEKGVADAQAYLDGLQKMLQDGLGSGELDLGDVFGQGGNSAENAAKRAKEAADQMLKVLSSLREIELQKDADFYKAQQENEALSLVERLRALNGYYKTKEQLIDLDADTESRLGLKTSAELLAIESKRQSDRIKLDRETYAERDKLINEFSKKFTEQEKKMYEGIDKIIAEGVKRWNKSEEERTKKEGDEAKKRIKQAEDEAEAKKRLQQELVKELTTLSFTIAAANTEREKNALQEQIDLLESKKQKDIEVANQTIVNAQDRAAAITVIEARAAAQKEELQRRQRDLDVRKAQFDKAQSIARIIQETAQNVVKYFGTPLALLAGAIGAVQLATVLAQPIPKYKHGKNVNDTYEGPAIVGDGGKKEAIIREDGRVEITSDRPQLTYVKSRDVVLPDATKLVDYVLAGKMGGKLISTVSTSTDNGLQREIKAMRADIVGAIKGKKELHIKAGDDGLTAVWKYGASQIKYLNENTNW